MVIALLVVEVLHCQCVWIVNHLRGMRGVKEVVVYMKIGRKIFYNQDTGEVIVSKGWMQGAVKELTLEQEKQYFPELNAVTIIGVKQLEFLEREDEFTNMGSLYVNPSTEELIIYPHFSLSIDKQQIQADGIDKTIIAITTQDDCTVTFRVDGFESETLNTVNKSILYEFQSEVQGIYKITVSTELYGQDNIEIEVI
jgi:hypothetical protein